MALGRQAFALLATELRGRGVRRLVVPSFSCQTMITPWQLEGYEVERVPVGPDLLMAADLLARRLAHQPRATVVLHCETFGNTASDRLSEVLARARADGVVLVVDRTHSFLAAPATACDHEVVSTRKLLDLPELAWVTGTSRPPARRGVVDRHLSEARRASLGHGDDELDERVEDLADEAWTPVHPDGAALSRWRRLDLAARGARILAARRRVLARVPGLHVVNPAAVAPLVVRRRDADEVLDRLHDRGVVGPIHWDRPRHLPGPWPEDLVCLPSQPDPRQLDAIAEVLRPG